MAANKRPRKKYSPKRNPLAACRYAHFVPKLAVSNEPLKDREVLQDEWDNLLTHQEQLVFFELNDEEQDKYLESCTRFVYRTLNKV